MSAYFYNLAAFVPTATTAYVATTSTSASVTATGTTQVLQTSSYTFTITTGNALATTDWVGIQFPQDYFTKTAQFSAVTCAQCSHIYIFGVTNMIYI